MPTLNELGRKVKAKYPGQYDDLSDLDLGRRMRAKYPDSYADFSGAEDAQAAAEPQKPVSFPKRMLGTLPTVGGIVGGAVGGGAGAAAGGVGAIPGAVGGAAIGGAGGEALRQTIEGGLQLAGVPGFEDAPETSLAALQQIGTEAAIQGASEVTGQGLSLGAKKLAVPFAQAAFRASPKVAQTAITEGISATRAGMQKTLNLLGEIGNKARAMLSSSPVQVDASHVGAEVWNRIAGGIKDQPLSAQDEVIARRMTKQFVREKGIMTAEKAARVKKVADRIATPIYKKILRQEPITGAESVRYSWHKHLADVLRENLHGTVPGLEALDARASDLIQVKQHLAPVVRGGTGFGGRVAKVAAERAPGAVLGGSIGYASSNDPKQRMMNAAAGGVAGSAISTPDALSKLALFLGDPLLAKMLVQAPRSVMEGARQ